MKHLECALGKTNEFWKYIIVLLVTFFGASFIGSIPLLVVILMNMASSGADMQGFQFDLNNLEAYGISSNLGLFLMMIPLVLGLFILIFFVKIFHNRNWKEIINGTNKVRWNHFFTGAGCWTILMALYYIIDYAVDPSNFVLQFDITTFIPLVIISLIMIPLQTSFEELAFRGYFAQGIGLLTKSRWMVFIIPSVIFGLIHYSNPEVKEFGFWLMMPQYILMGMIFAITSILDDGIEVAMGVHAANNVFLSLFLTHSSSALQTAAVMSQQTVNPYKELIMLIVMGTLLVGILYKKYNWKFSTLNKRVKPENDIVINLN